MKTCKDCGVEITPENSYSKGSATGVFKPPTQCKPCENGSRAIRKAKLAASRFLFKQTIGQVVRRKYFDTEAERDRAIADRTTIKRFGTVSIGHSSKVGTRVTTTVAKEDEESKFEADVACSECSGLIRFNLHLEKQCTQCGLIAPGVALIPDDPHEVEEGEEEEEEETEPQE